MTYKARVWHSILTNQIYFGNVNTDTNKATKNRIAITNDAVNAVAEYLLAVDKSVEFTLESGEKITLSVTKG
ncbi:MULTISPECIES: DUF7446 family protein [Providencia]|uniref:DUF7446 family protein n=1 Tax=Providencia TaxID=586 RepID=UPI003D2823B0